MTTGLNVSAPVAETAKGAIPTSTAVLEYPITANHCSLPKEKGEKNCYKYRF